MPILPYHLGHVSLVFDDELLYISSHPGQGIPATGALDVADWEHADLAVAMSE
jgi:hypothetical protein